MKEKEILQEIIEWLGHGAVRREFPKQARMRIRNADRIGAVFAFNFRDFKHKTNL